MVMGPYKKKLIEVALPLDAINKACAREKSFASSSTISIGYAAACGFPQAKPIASAVCR